MNLECKKIALFLCFKAIAITIGTQILLLDAIILLLNFNLLHPIKWFLQLFGFHWLRHVPLLCFLLLNGLLLSKSYSASRKYFPNRYKWITSNGLNKLVLLAVDILLGLSTAWSIMSYLDERNGSLYSEKDGVPIINSHYTFLCFAGIAIGCFYSVRYHLRRGDIPLQYEFIAKPTSVRLRESFLQCLWTSTRSSVLPVIGVALLYWMLSGFIERRLSLIVGLAGVSDDSLNSLLSIFTNIRLLFYAWLIVIEFLIIMNLMENVFSIFLTTPCHFPISANPLELNGKQVTLTIALSMNDIPIVQKLAALDFYNLAKAKLSERRMEIYALSQPGGHPYNWNQLSAQCLSIMNSYIDELGSSMKSLPATLQQSTPSLLSTYNNGQPPNATELAQRILIRQYNEKHNIRRLKSDMHGLDAHNHHSQSSSSTVARINENFNRTTEEIMQRVAASIRSLPGVFYMFGEPEGAKLSYLLSNCDLLIWIVHGIAHICAASLTEDPYGVVQLTLPEIMKTLLKFKNELDRLSSVNLNMKKLDPNLMPLRNALKRSLHKICNAFADYLPEIVEDTNDLPYLRTFVYQQTKIS